jgi:hypothetical protein
MMLPGEKWASLVASFTTALMKGCWARRLRGIVKRKAIARMSESFGR